MKIRMLHPAVGEFSFPIDPGGEAILGRRGADVEITWDRRISRRHARVWAEGTRLFFEDLGSRNGSFIGSDRLNGTVELQPGMSVLLGQTALLVPHHAEKLALADVDQTVEAPSVPKEEDDHALTGTQDLLPSLLGQDLGLSVPTNTDDLPILEPAEAFVDDKKRQYPRLVGQHLAKVELGEREELRALWVHDISKGGVFIETDSPLGTGSRLEVRLQTPDGTLSLHGSVVHVVDAESSQKFNMPAGVGVQFVDLTPQKKQAIQEYVDGLREKLTSELETTESVSDVQIDELLQKAKAFMAAAEDDQLYKALEVEPTASITAIQGRVRDIQDELSHALLSAPPPQQARLQAAQGVVKRVGRLMTNDQSRLEYDFRHGHVRAKERLAAAHGGTGPSVEMLRRTWNRVSHDRVDQAALLFRRAFAARQAKRWEEAIGFAKQALALNPFFEELEKTLEAWELASTADLSAAYPRRSSRSVSRARRAAAGS